MHRLLNIESTKIHKPNIDSSRLKVTHVYLVIRPFCDIRYKCNYQTAFPYTINLKQSLTITLPLKDDIFLLNTNTLTSLRDG